MSSKQPNHFKLMMLTTLAHWISKEKSDIIEYLLEYNRILKSKLEKDNKRIKFTEQERARLARKGHKIRWKSLKALSELITPETLFRWYKRLIANKYTPKKPMPYSERKARKEYVRRLVCRMAKENPRWGAGRIVGALKALGIYRCKSTVYKMMLDNGFDPNPEGHQTRKNRTWLEFIKTHSHLMLGADFLTAEVLTLRGLVRYLIFFTIDCSTKRVKILHIGHSTCGETMERIAIQMTDHYDGFQKSKKYFYCDKDPLYTKKFKRIIEESGLELRQVPNPVCNPHAERFVKSIKNECLDHLILFNEGMLFRAVKEYEKFYNTERPHQNLGNGLIAPNENLYKDYLPKETLLQKTDTILKSDRNKTKETSTIADGLIVKSERLGGLLNFYYRKTG